MKNFQTHILHCILEPLQEELGDHVAAYRKGLGCRDAALQHVRDGAKSTHLHMDIQEFFKSTRRSYVRRYLKNAVGYNHDVASLLASLLTVKDGKRNYVPQGNPTSGAITNLIANEWIDQHVLKHLQSLEGDWVYTRYADDMHISVANENADTSTEAVNSIIKFIDATVRNAGYKVKRKKTRVDRHHKQQKVLGVVVNDKGHMDRRTYDRMKAIIHNCFVFGFEKQIEWQKKVNEGAFITWMNGKISYYVSIDPKRGGKLHEKWDMAKARWEVQE